LAGTVTGESVIVYIGTHAAGATMTWGAKSNTLYGMGDFSVTFARGIIEQGLIGVAGNYKDQGTLKIDGSLKISKLDTSGNSSFLNSILDGTGTNKFFAVSSNLCGAGDNASLRFTLVSCQVTGWDTSIGDADTITEANVKFVEVNPQSITYKGGLVSDR
jgi:hypothetical protein